MQLPRFKRELENHITYACSTESFRLRLPGICCCREVNCCEHRFPKRVKYSLTATNWKRAASIEPIRDLDEEHAYRMDANATGSKITRPETRMVS
jgi:hypothetical protein